VCGQGASGRLLGIIQPRGECEGVWLAGEAMVGDLQATPELFDEVRQGIQPSRVSS